jgi:ERF superfamily
MGSGAQDGAAIMSAVIKMDAPTPLTPMEMLNAAIVRGDSIDKLERLMDLNDRWEKAQAKKAYIEAKAAFKAHAPKITRDKENTQYKSRYASIGNVVNTVNEELSKHGLDADWSYDQTSGIKVTCKLTHILGHSESVSLTGAPDTSGAKNPLQQIKSTLTYLKLATFEAVTGIATKEGNLDDDGNSSGGAAGPITDAQLKELIALADSVGADKAKFCEYHKIESFADIRTDQFENAKARLNLKKGKTRA